MADAFIEYFVNVVPKLACSMAADSDVTFFQYVSPTQSVNVSFKLLAIS